MERVRLISRSRNCPTRIRVGDEGRVVRSAGIQNGTIWFVRWDNGDRSWHPTSSLQWFGEQRRGA